jgi:uncharacterized protein (DUF1778 family)
MLSAHDRDDDADPGNADADEPAMYADDSEYAVHPAARGERLETRVSSDQKSLIGRAAALQGRTVTDFVLTSVQDAARRAIEEDHSLDLSMRDSQAFVEALINPKPVNDRLRETVRPYRETTGV